jgi:phosphoribosylformylglycinamidine (FGAM) synthase PurS component
MQNVELFVVLKVPDTVALTAQDTIKRKMGYGETLKYLMRADYWKIGLDYDDRTAAEERLHEIIEKTNIFINPNKHFYSIDKKPLAKCMGAFSVNVLVSEMSDDEIDIITSLHRQGFTEIKSVETGVLWHFELQTNSQKDAEHLALELTNTESRKQGLLANPHSQNVQILN